MAAPEQTLEALVRDELRPHVAEIVARLVPELVAEELQLNGAAPAPIEGVNGTTTAPSTKVCTLCGRELPAGSFDRHRNQCKQCRDRERRRQAAAESEVEPAG